jgi:hypothetical protein
MKVTKGQLLGIWDVLEKVGKQKAPIKFAYGLAKNKRLFKDEIGAINEARVPPESFQEFEKKRITVCRKLADKDDKGQPITIDVLGSNGEILSSRFQTTENAIKLDEEINALREEYTDAINEFDEREEEILKLLEEEVEFDIFKIAFSQFPDKMSADHMEVLLDFVDDDSEQEEK